MQKKNSKKNVNVSVKSSKRDEQSRFIKKYGDEPQEVTRNYTVKSLGTNYSIRDAFNELCDNANDAKVEGKVLDFVVKVDTVKHEFVFTDNGCGVKDDKSLFKLGGTDKEADDGKIGKYGIGVPGAVSAIATKCVHDKGKMVEIIFESARDGKMFTKHVGIMPNGEMTIGKTVWGKCDESCHYTNITFTNVSLKSEADVMDSLEETFEEPLRNGLKITFNGVRLGSGDYAVRTFVGDESAKTVMVGDFPVKVKYRIIGGEECGTKDRVFDESGLRVYDEKNGRLLAKSTDLWFWYGGRKAQQNICGLRAAIYIPSGIAAYNKFGIKPAKNGVTYSKYFSTDPDFSELSNELGLIYCRGAKTKYDKRDDVITIGSRMFQPTPIKMDSLYKEVAPGNYIIKKKCTARELATLVDKVITLEKKASKQGKKGK